MSKFDPIEHHNSGNRVMGMNVNHCSVPVLRHILTESLSEFDPEYWAELNKMPLSYRTVAIQTYERVRQRIQNRV